MEAAVQKKPQTIDVAAQYLWVNLGLVIAVYLISLRSDIILMSILELPFIILEVFISYKLIRIISQGLNWARIALLLLQGSVVLTSAYQLLSGQLSMLDSVAILLQNGLVVYALYLLFTPPGSGFFTKDPFIKYIPTQQKIRQSAIWLVLMVMIFAIAGLYAARIYVLVMYIAITQGMLIFGAVYTTLVLIFGAILIGSTYKILRNWC